MRGFPRNIRPQVRPTVPSAPIVPAEIDYDREDQCLPELWAPKNVAIPSLWIDLESGAVHDGLNLGDVLDGIYLSDGMSHI
jgi:hypothetical protein